MFKSIKKSIFIVGLLIALSLNASLSSAAPLSSALSVDVTEGQNFNLVISVDPEGVKNYTTQMELSFPADLLEITAFDFVSGWMPLSQAGYDLIDNANGELNKTAGYPNGAADKQEFGTVSFTAKQDGTGTLSMIANFLKITNVAKSIVVSEIDGGLVDGTEVHALNLETGEVNIVLSSQNVVLCKAEIEGLGVDLIETTFQSNFRDIRKHWGENYIKILECLKIVSGREEGLFVPDGALNRAEMTKIAVEALNIPMTTVTQKPFTDVSVNAWHAPYIKAAYDAGIIQGYDDGLFRPGQDVTRAEALKILLEATQIELVSTKRALVFSDVGLEDWFLPYISTAKDLGFVSGYEDKSFRPNSSISRAEMSKIVVKVLEDLELEKEQEIQEETEAGVFFGAGSKETDVEKAYVTK